MSPGKQVSRKRSTTSAPEGAELETSLIFSPSITTNTFFRIESDRPSNRDPQCKTTLLALATCAQTELDDIQNNKSKIGKTTFPLMHPPTTNDQRQLFAFPVQALWTTRLPTLSNCLYREAHR